MVETALIVLAVLILCGVAWRRMGRRKPRPSRTQESVVPQGLSLRAKPMLTKHEAQFYNLLRLAVQEQYLIFAKVPLWSVVAASAKQPQDHSSAEAFLKRIIKRRMDFVLVHPGTLAVDTVVQLENGAPVFDGKEVQDRLVRNVFRAAGIKLVRVKAEGSYTAPALATLLGVPPLE